MAPTVAEDSSPTVRAAEGLGASVGSRTSGRAETEFMANARAVGGDRSLRLKLQLRKTRLPRAVLTF
jgi:hypothetical protein